MSSKTTAVYAHKAILRTVSHELYSLLVVPYTIMRILLNASKITFKLNNLILRNYLPSTVLVIRSCLSPFSMAVLEKLTVANVCFCSNEYAYD
jgi:hypothetical protein